MAKTDNYTKNAGKPTAWDKVKDFINIGRQYQTQAIEKLPTYYADRINSNKNDIATQPYRGKGHYTPHLPQH